MGLRGAPPTPTAINKIRGFPGKRKPGADEPMPTIGAPAMPDYLDEVAVQEWNRLMPELLKMRVVTEADAIPLGNLCQAYSILIDAQRQLQKTGILYKTKSGYIQQSPLLGIIHAQTTIVNGLAREFGLTPSSRTRIKAAPAASPDVNKFSKLG
jgi:P27 family predicted phage terminase small subunit